MIVELFSFQKTALERLRSQCASAISSYQSEGPQVISFTAPTGAGKTIIVSALIESILFGDARYMAMPDAVIVWLSDSPELNEQSKLKIESKADKVQFGQCVTITDDAFDAELLEDGHIYFLNTQKLSKTSNLTKHSDTRQFTIWETLQNTIEEKSNRLFFVIDEAHRGAQGKEAAKATTIMQKFIKGSKEDHLSPMPVVLGMTATPERFNNLVAGTDSTIKKTVISADEVRKSGLLKEKIIISYPEDQTTNKNMAVLQAATDEWKEKCNRWFQYCQEQHYAHVYPVFVVQVENGKNGHLSETNLDDCVKKIEDRVGVAFKEGDVVHAFGEHKDLEINGMTVRYEEPSRIAENRAIKVVLFKDSLSTGWDCPRAETMMSFRTANDATYIAQLLGRMVRTPLQMRVQVDETLNDVHLYLPHFDAQTVEKVVDALQDSEGGNIPTEVIEEAIGSQKTETLSVVTSPRPVSATRQPIIDNEPTVDSGLFSDGASEEEQPSTTATVKTNDFVFQTRSEGHTSHTSSVKTPVVEKPASEETTDEITSSIDRVRILNWLNGEGFLSYGIRKSRVNDYLTSLFKLLWLLNTSNLNREAVKNERDAIVEMIHSHIESLKAAGKYDELAKKIMEFKLQSQIFDVYGQSVDHHEVHDMFSTTDTDVERQFRLAEAKLGNEGIGTAYGSKFYDPNAEYSYQLDVIIFTADDTCMQQLHTHAKDKYHYYIDEYRRKIAAMDEKIKYQFNTIASNGDEVSEHNLELPKTINVNLDKDGTTCTDHLFVNEAGAATFKLTSWETAVLEEERKSPDFICWYRNPSRDKPGALCIPYEMDNEIRPMFPDFIIVRRDETEGYQIDVLEPHNSALKDNLPKAKGLAKYAQKNPNVSRVQMIRLAKDITGTQKLLRLDMAKSLVWEKVLKANDNEEFDHIFEEYGIVG